MRTPPSELPPVPEGWTYIGNEAEINIDGCETDFARGVHITRKRGGWGEDIHTVLHMWWDGVSQPNPKWHYIAVNGSRLALLNGGTCLCGGEMVVEDEAVASIPGYAAGCGDGTSKYDELHAIIGRLRGDVKERAAELGKLKDELDHRAAALDRWQAAYHDAASRADKLEREKRALREAMIRHRDLLVEYAGD